MARNKLVWLVCLSILSVLPASATFVLYSDLGLWQQVTTLSGTTIDFSSLGVPVGGQTSYPLPLVIDGLTFTSTVGQLQVVNASSGQGYYNWGTASILHTVDDNRGVVAAWPTPVTAFAALMGITKMAGDVPVTSQMDVKVRSGGTVVWEQVLVTSARPTLTFFGIVSTDPAVTFDSVTFTPPAFDPPPLIGIYTNAFLDDVRRGTYNAPVVDQLPGDTPELGTGVLSLCGGILLAAGGFRKRGRPFKKA
jgi:hypothetical protein